MNEFSQFNEQSEIQFITKLNEVEIYLLREDQIHPNISGNKFRKLKYNLEAFKNGNYSAMLTFGGAYSNHIAAVAAAGKEFSIPTIGIIRGEELESKYQENPTLQLASQNGMKLEFISRSEYRNKSNPEFLEILKEKFGNVYILPEGGTNEFAVKGCEEILGQHTKEYNFIACPMGTAGTISGIIRSCNDKQTILGFPALKNADFLREEIQQWTSKSNFDLILDYHFGGYAKITPQFIDFLNEFTQKYNVNLDPIYSGKMMFGLLNLVKQNFFPAKSKVLAIHTGGLQGIKGINQQLIQENKAIIR
ncbi:1-aminocyclopropane-1-carboxylate deaminase/D-cysteine desulfhydrase [Moheibacter stercoris]|uniref:1-aminocyclopropane-1-carboxylate deaminase n=1 Tax=Moheibacter stercoris TaxID=1628251 RepID=A0ABV2LZJ3_9FLAO